MFNAAYYLYSYTRFLVIVCFVYCPFLHSINNRVRPASTDIFLWIDIGGVNPTLGCYNLGEI